MIDAKPAFVFDGRNILDRSKMESIDLCIRRSALKDNLSIL
jgi:hypothetical protein